MLTGANHFGHRKTDGVVVDLFWDRRDQEDQFRVEVEDEREGVRFVLRPTNGREALQAFYHPFSVVHSAAPTSAERWSRSQERGRKA